MSSLNPNITEAVSKDNRAVKSKMILLDDVRIILTEKLKMLDVECSSCKISLGTVYLFFVSNRLTIRDPAAPTSGGSGNQLESGQCKILLF